MRPGILKWLLLDSGSDRLGNTREELNKLFTFEIPLEQVLIGQRHIGVSGSLFSGPSGDSSSSKR